MALFYLSYVIFTLYVQSLYTFNCVSCGSPTNDFCKADLGCLVLCALCPQPWGPLCSSGAFRHTPHVSLGGRDLPLLIVKLCVQFFFCIGSFLVQASVLCSPVLTFPVPSCSHVCAWPCCCQARLYSHVRGRVQVGRCMSKHVSVCEQEYGSEDLSVIVSLNTFSSVLELLIGCTSQWDRPS